VVRGYATSWKVADSKPDEVKFFYLPNSSDRTRPWGSLNLLHKYQKQKNNNVSGE
jgi:hypothetical protein